MEGVKIEFLSGEQQTKKVYSFSLSISLPESKSLSDNINKKERKIASIPTHKELKKKESINSNY